MFWFTLVILKHIDLTFSFFSFPSFLFFFPQGVWGGGLMAHANLELPVQPKMTMN